MVNDWIKDNLDTFYDYEMDEYVIKWSENMFTPLEYFENTFGSVIEDSLNKEKNVREAISTADDGRGYAKYILN